MSDEIRRLWDNAWYGAEQRQWVSGRIGYPSSDGTTVIVEVPHRKDFVYVRMGYDGENGIDVARRRPGVALRPNLPVRMRRERGTLVIYEANFELMENDPNNPLDSSGVPIHYHNFLDLRDTPTTYASHAGRYVRVNGAEDALEYDDLDLEALGDPAHRTVQRMQDFFHSAGIATGGVISISATADSVDVSSGSGWIRASNDPTTTLYAFEWPAATALSVPDGTTRYLGVEYNAGTPQVVVRTTDNFNRQDEFLIGSATNDGTDIHISQNGYAVGDHASAMISRLLGTAYIAWDKRYGGLVISETGTRNIALTAGRLWSGLKSFDVSALDTSVTGTFGAYYYNGSVWVEADISQWPNTEYNDTASGLVTMTNNRYANLWWYVDLEGDLYMVYGQAEYPLLADALDEQPPGVIPPVAQDHSILVARTTFQKSDATFQEITSALIADLPAGVAASDHGLLSGLGDDDHTQYPLDIGRAGGQSLSGGNAASEDLTLDSTSHATKGNVLIQPSGGNVKIGTDFGTPYGLLEVAGDISARASTGAVGVFLASGSTAWRIYHTTTGGVMGFWDYNNTKFPLILEPNHNNYMRVASGGVAINRITAAVALDVDGRIRSGPSSGDAVVELFPSSNDDVNLYSSATDDRYGFYNYGTGASDFVIKHSNGYVGIGQVNPEDRMVVELNQAAATRIGISNNNAAGYSTLIFREGAGTFPGWVQWDNAANLLQFRNNLGSEIQFESGNGQDLFINLFSDRGDDNADKWRMWITNASIRFQHFGTGAWVTKSTISA